MLLILSVIAILALLSGVGILRALRFRPEAETPAEVREIPIDGDRAVELETVAVDVVNANRETLRTEFEGPEECASYARAAIGESDLVLESPEGLHHLYAFSTCSYQTGNSRTVVYAIEKGGT